MRTCDYNGKLGYEDDADARVALREIKARQKRLPKHRRPKAGETLHVYRCHHCGDHHLGRLGRRV